MASPKPKRPIAKAPVRSTLKPKASTKELMPKITKTAKPKVLEPKRPMVGNDKAFAKKYGSKSHNNGYTN
jgi:hypothetical protein